MELLLKKAGPKYLESIGTYNRENFLENFRKPLSRSELYLITNGEVQFSQLGSTKSRVLENGYCYYFKPRNRGSEVYSISNDFTCSVATMNPIYCQDIFQSDRGNKLHKIEGTSSFEKDIYISLMHQNERLLNQTLSEQFNHLHSTKRLALLKEATQTIHNAQGIITIREVYSSLNVSKSTLEQLFHSVLNMTPKEYARIVRLNYFIGKYQASSNGSLTEITYECGFYDQSHLIKEFRYFLNQTPSQYFKSFDSVN